MTLTISSGYLHRNTLEGARGDWYLHACGPTSKTYAAVMIISLHCCHIAYLSDRWNGKGGLRFLGESAHC